MSGQVPISNLHRFAPKFSGRLASRLPGLVEGTVLNPMRNLVLALLFCLLLGRVLDIRLLRNLSYRKLLDTIQPTIPGRRRISRLLRRRSDFSTFMHSKRVSCSYI